MIVIIEASGFRSLDKFRMKLVPGINILVGPNGGGKSNIIGLFRFIGLMVTQGLSSAVSETGGPNHVFRQLPDGKLCNNFKARVVGIVTPEDQEEEEEEHIAVMYDYSFSVILQRSALSFGKQSLTLYILKEPGRKGRSPFLKVQGSDQRGFEVSNLIVKDLGLNALPEGHTKRAQIVQDIRAVAQSAKWQPQCLLDRLSGPLFRVWCVMEDLSKGLMLNVDPGIAMQPQSFGAEAGLLSTGKGLPATLLEIRNNDRSAYRRIEELLKLANTEIAGVKVKSNKRDATHNIFLQMSSEKDKTIELPLSAMSDGTIKWLVLVTGVEHYKRTLAGFIIEEPENFLHPWMQQEIMKLLKEIAEENPLTTILVSTHSETILNCATADEVCVCSMEGGVTRVDRAKNAEELEKMIRESGFGLGHFYLAGAVEHE